MLNLLKTDLKRVFKDKLFLILCIIAAAFAIFNPLVYKLLFAMVDMVEELDMAIDAKTLCFTSFSPGNNLGLIMPIFAALVLCKDFSQGTIRNKIICGKTRTQIFLSMLITCAIVMCVVMFFHGILTLLFSRVFFEYQAAPFTWGSLGYMLLSFGLEMLVYVFMAALLTLLIVWSKKRGLGGCFVRCRQLPFRDFREHRRRGVYVRGSVEVVLPFAGNFERRKPVYVHRYR